MTPEPIFRPPTLPVSADLFQDWPDCLLIVSVDGNLIRCNHAAAAVLGLNSERDTGKHVHDLVCCEYAANRHLAEDCPLLIPPSQTPPDDIETVWLRSDGAGINISYRTMALAPNSDTTGIVIIARAIPESRLSNEEYQKVLSFADNNPAPIAELGTNGTLLFTNPTMMELLLEHGYNEDGTPRALPDKLSSLVNTCIERQTGIHDVEATVGEQTYLWRLHYEPARGVVQAYGAEVTSLKQALQSVEEAKVAADQATQAKSAFLANMSHEIRTPMNGIMGMLELLVGSGVSDEQNNYIRIARSSADSLLTLINDILDFSKIEAGKMQLETVDFNLKELLEDVSQLMQESARNKGLELHKAWGSDTPSDIKTDPTRVRQILLNLLTNAIKFTTSGSVTLSAARQLENDGRSVLRFAVSDTGIGIAPDAQPLLFNSFTQADVSTTRRFGGTGLGLAICKQLAELMGGRIGVESKLGSGSTFWFTVPLFPGDPTSRQIEHHVGTELKFRAEVLLVEDNRVNQLVAVGMLGKFGIKPDIANNGLEALQAVAQKNYDLVLMDCQMPQMDGYCATRRIREQPARAASRLPIVAMTANALEADRDNCLAAGMDDYITKPVSMKSLGQTLAHWLKHRADIVKESEHSPPDTDRQTMAETSTII